MERRVDANANTQNKSMLLGRLPPDILKHICYVFLLKQEYACVSRSLLSIVDVNWFWSPAVYSEFKICNVSLAHAVCAIEHMSFKDVHNELKSGCNTLQHYNTMVNRDPQVHLSPSVAQSNIEIFRMCVMTGGWAHLFSLVDAYTIVHEATKNQVHKLRAGKHLNLYIHALESSPCFATEAEEYNRSNSADTDAKCALFYAKRLRLPDVAMWAVTRELSAAAALVEVDTLTQPWFMRMMSAANLEHIAHLVSKKCRPDEKRNLFTSYSLHLRGRQRDCHVARRLLEHLLEDDPEDACVLLSLYECCKEQVVGERLFNVFVKRSGHKSLDPDEVIFCMNFGRSNPLANLNLGALRRSLNSEIRVDLFCDLCLRYRQYALFDTEPPNEIFHEAKVIAYCLQDRHQDALDVGRTLVPKQLRTFRFMARSAFALGDDAKGAALLDEYKSLETNGTLMLEWARVKLARGELEAARDDLAQAEQLGDPNNTAFDWDENLQFVREALRLPT